MSIVDDDVGSGTFTSECFGIIPVVITIIIIMVTGTAFATIATSGCSSSSNEGVPLIQFSGWFFLVVVGYDTRRNNNSIHGSSKTGS